MKLLSKVYYHKSIRDFGKSPLSKNQFLKKNVLITGASSPLALCFLEWLTSHHYVTIALSRRTSKKLSKLIHERVLADLFVGSLADIRYVTRTVDSISEKYGHLDILVNNASGWYEGGLQTTSLRQIDSQVQSSVVGTIALTKLCLPLLRRAKGSWVINVCSTVGTGYRFTNNTLYVALKGAMDAFGRSLRNDLRHEAIRVVNLHLGKLDDGEPKEPPCLKLSDVSRVLDFLVSISAKTSVDSICMTPLEYEY